VPVAEMESPVMLRHIVGQGSPEPSEERFRRVVDRAVADGWLLRYTVHASGQPETYLLLSTAQNRELMDRLRGDDGEVARVLEIPDAARVTVYRPNVFALYEHHIGPLTPLIAEQLRDAERLYPRFWLEEAMRQAVQYNKRNWRYMSAILARWEVTGGPDGIPRRHS
jgi:DnaD/phage-associated family protein